MRPNATTLSLALLLLAACDTAPPGLDGGDASPGADGGDVAAPDGAHLDGSSPDASRSDGGNGPDSGPATDAAPEDDGGALPVPSACVSGQIRCGDRCVTTPAMACEDGNDDAGDGCYLCAVEPGWSCAGAPSACATTCGDGVIAGDERCDDGNTADGDGCGGDCQSGFCVVTVTHPTIQAAIDDTACRFIRVPAGTYSERLQVARALTIFGDSATGTIIDGSALGSVVTSSARPLRLRSLTLRNGAATNGGGIRATAPVELDNVIVQGNTALESGGGIAMEGIAPELTVRNRSVIENNSATLRGGGISAEDDVRIEGASVVRGNTVTATLGGAGGGGIHSTGSVEIDGSIVEDNRALSMGATSITGGGIDADGLLTVANHSAIRNNSVENPNTGSIGNAFGGGASASTVNVSLSEIRGNLALASGTFAGTAVGGGLSFSGLSPQIVDSVIEENVAHGIGNNDAEARGGGISSVGAFTLLRSTVERNVATTTSDRINPAYGAGIYLTGTTGQARIDSSTIADNRGEGGAPAGAGIFVVAGAVGVSFNSLRVELINSTISGNTALGPVSEGGGLVVRSTASDSARITLSVRCSTIVGNASEVGASGVVFSHSSGTGGRFLLHDSVLTDNGASGSSGDWSCSNVEVDSQYNAIGSVDGCTRSDTTGDHDLVGVAAMLGPLEDNGGRTRTHLPAATSPLIDAGDPAGCTDGTGSIVMVDQRGFPRTGASDLGAVER